MARILNNWLDSYLEYAFETESPRIFHKFVGLSMISGALMKKCWFNFGRFKIYPNQYIVLVSEPGCARKTQAISCGTKILTEVPSVRLSADATTREALLQDLEEFAMPTTMPDGSTFTHASLSIISREFESFLGQKKDNTKMLVTLTDLYDCEELPFKYRTKHSGSNEIPLVYLNLLGATTPESLASSLPATAIGGGLTSRIIFVWAPDKEKKVAIPELSPEAAELRMHLIRDLTVISRIVGGYNYSTDSRAKWYKWYDKYDERDPNRICKDPAFLSWYSRKPTSLIKMSVCLAAAKHSDPVVEWEDFEHGLKLLEEIERTMGKAFTAVGKSDVTAETELVFSVIEMHGSISEKQLLQIVWRDIDARKFDNIISTCLRSGRVRRDFTGPDGKKGVWYSWNK